MLVTKVTRCIIYTASVLVNRYDDSVIGGESLLLDCYPILEDLRNNYPEQFHTLTRVPATFQSIHHTGSVTYRAGQVTQSVIVTVRMCWL